MNSHARRGQAESDEQAGAARDRLVYRRPARARAEIAFEREGFADPVVFEQLVQTETALVDDYARGRLSPRLRKQFELYYLAHPRGGGLRRGPGTRIGEIQGTARVEQPIATVSWQERALPSLAVAGCCGFRWRQSRRSSMLTDRLASVSQGAAARPGRGADRKGGRRTARARPAASALRPRARRHRVHQRAAVVTRRAAGVVSLLLSIGRVRGSDTGPAPTLVISPRRGGVRIEFALGQQDYPGYRVALKMIAGPDVFASASQAPEHEIGPQPDIDGASRSPFSRRLPPRRER